VGQYRKWRRDGAASLALALSHDGDFMNAAKAVPTLILLAAACSRGGQVAQRIPSDSAQYFRTQVEELSSVSAAKDSLVRDLAETTKLLSDINTEILKVSTAKPVEPVVGNEGVATNDRAAILKRVQDLTARLKTNETRLATSQRRLRSLTKESDSLKVNLTGLQQTIDGLQATLEAQKNTIATMEAELTGAREQVATLTTEKTTLTDTVSALTTRENTVYYTIGTKKDLKEKGIVTEAGGTRFLIFTRTGEVLKPVDHLNPSDFTAIDRRAVTRIEMPNPDKEYQLVTDQNIAATNIPPDSKRRFKGALEITNPELFWAQSKFLIVVER
jgi:predicted  nucleic acid-binding Zn-ribbon protein